LIERAAFLRFEEEERGTAVDEVRQTNKNSKNQDQQFLRSKEE
jgi:hypothetical protein